MLLFQEISLLFLFCLFFAKNFRKNKQQVQLKIPFLTYLNKRPILRKQDKADERQVFEEAYQGSRLGAEPTEDSRRLRQAEREGFSIYQLSKSYFVFPVSNPCFNQPEDRRKVFCASLNVGERDFNTFNVWNSNGGLTCSSRNTFNL